MVYLDDDLSMGPIDRPTPEVRAAWFAERFGYDHDEICERAHQVLTDLASEEMTPIAWFSRRCAHEYAGFLELVWRRGDLPLLVVDVANLELSETFQDSWVRRPAPAPSE